MDEIIAQLTFPPLSASASADDFALHEAALEWSLADPIIIERAEDIKSRVNWQDRLKPFDHQVQNLITFCRRLPVTLLTDDVGLGKTISAGLILSELMIRNRVARTLVICPKILGPQWIEELKSKFGIHGTFAVGKQLDEELSGSSEVVATTYHSASGRLEKIEPGKFDMLILDEAHKLRNLHGSHKPPQIAQRIHKALDARLFKYVVMLTATPIQNRLWDIYSLVECLAVAKGHANPLGTPNQFKTRYVADHPHAKQLNPSEAESFRSILRQYLVRTRRQDAKLLFPDRKVNLWKVKPSTIDDKLQALVAQHMDRLNGFQQSSVALAMMSSPQALIAQLNNMANRDPHWRLVADDAKRISSDDLLPSKLRDLLKIVKQLRLARPGNWRLIVFTTRIETQNVICQKLDLEGIAFGRIQGGAPAGNLATVKSFTLEPPAINVIVSTDAGAEGVNLQVGNVLVNYDLPWNPMIIEQRIGRIQRLGSQHNSVSIHNLAVEGSPEERVVVRLMDKLQTIVDTVGDIEAILEASFGDNDSSAESFEKQIRDLVLKSLKGQDVDEAMRRQINSIESAKNELERQRRFIDSTLGRLDELHQTGPSMPRLTPVIPSMKTEQFVQQAFEAEGFLLKSDHGVSLRADKRGKASEYITFDEQYWRQNSQSGVFQGKALRLYKPGKPAFERMVQRWLDRSAHYTKSFVDQTKDLAYPVAEKWLTRISGSSFEDIDILASEERFQGRSRFRVTAINAVDSYEKLVDIETVPAGHDRIFDRELDDGRVIYQELEPDSLDPSIELASNIACSNDPDVSAFCGFYLSRLKEELAKAGLDEGRIKKVEDDFSPAIHAQTVALTGLKYQSCRVRIHFAIDGHRGYSTEIDAVPLTSQIIEEPTSWASCQKSGRAVPSDCLDECCISAQRVLRHYLRVSDESGRKALEEHANVCPVTGRVALNDEFLTSDLSGQRAVASAFQKSEMSGRRGLLDEFGTCEFSGSRILLDEFETSEITGRKYRRDQGSSSVVSARNGHQSEFVKCDYSNTTVLPDECDKSDLSSRRIRRDQMEISVRPPNRRGARDEIVICPVSGNRLLSDETGKCAITSQQVDDSLLATCSETGQRALAALMVTCELSGLRILPAETVCSAVSNRRILRRLAVFSVVSGQAMLPDESVSCEITGLTLLPDETVVSELSGRKFRNDEQVKSEVSGRIGHRSEGSTCDWTGHQLLSDEACQSAISSRLLKKAIAVASPISGRLAHPDELQSCEFSGILVFPDELLTSDASGKRFRVDELFVSTSGRRGHRTEQSDCEFSGQSLLLDEVVKSDVSGKRISKQIARQSVVSGQLAAPEEFDICELTGAFVLHSECLVSDLSGKRFRRDEIARSDKSMRVGHRSEAVCCNWTGRQLLLDESSVSDFSGRAFAKSDERLSPISARRGFTAEFESCEITGALVLLDELISSDVSGRRFRCDELFRSSSGRQGHTSESVKCEFSQESVLEDEIVVSAVSRRLVARAIAHASEASGEFAAPDELAECEITGAKVLPSELIESALSGKYFRCDEHVEAARSQRVGHRSESVTCKFSRQTYLADEIGISDFSGKEIGLEYLRRSSFSGRLGAPDEFNRCAITGQQLLLDELAESVVSLRTVSKHLLVASDRSGDLALPEEMVLCQVSGASLLPTETVECAVSGLIVDARLVVQSQLSEHQALPDQMLVCSISGYRGLPREFGRCTSTGDLVAEHLLERCQATGQLFLRDLLIQSSLSMRWMIPDQAKKSFRDGRLMCPDEAAFCNWNRGFLPSTEAKTCRRSNLTFAEELMSKDGVFRGFKALIKGTHSNMRSADKSLLAIMRSLGNGQLKSLGDASYIEADKDGIFAVHGEVQTFLGFTRGRVLFLMRRSPNGTEILGKIAFGSSNGENWKSS